LALLSKIASRGIQNPYIVKEDTLLVGDFLLANKVIYGAQYR